MAPTTKPSGAPFRVLTFNNAPERAFKLVGRVVADIKANEVLLLDHVGNCASLEEVSSNVDRLRPDILMCASMWTPEENTKVFETGRRIIGSNLLTHAIPQGMQSEKGPDFVVEYLKGELPKLVDGAVKQGRTEERL